MLKIIENSKIIVCVGSGGVGKTTLASTLGFIAAKEGKRALVLTVDPAKRLKTTMGLEDQSEPVQIKHAGLKGELYASVIDAKKTFDDFVLRAAAGSETAKKLMSNKLYIQLSTTLSGSQEFTALEKLYTCFESGRYDLIVLDTPPTKHAIDFLEAPEKLSGIFNEGIAKWFRDPGAKSRSFFVGLLHAGTKQVLRVLESMTGSEFIHELGEFFLSIEGWQNKIEERISNVHRLLTANSTQFCLVTSLDEAKLKEAEYFSKEINKGGYHLSAMIINRAYPSWTKVKSDQIPEDLKELYQSLYGYYTQREELFQKFSIRMGSQSEVVRVPELSESVSDMEGVELLSEYLSLKDERS